MRDRRPRPQLVVLSSLTAVVAVVVATLAVWTALVSPAASSFSWQAIAVAASAGVAAALGISQILMRLLLKPLRRIERFASDVASGELDRRLRWRGGGDPGRIADALDAMADELQRRLGEATSEKEQLQAVLAGMVEGVLVVNAEGRIVLANHGCARCSTMGEVGRTPLELIRHAGVHDALRERHRPPAVVRQITIEGADERAISSAAAFPLGPAARHRRGVSRCFGLRRLESLRRDFVANVSHELKTPLTAIRGFAERCSAPICRPRT